MTQTNNTSIPRPNGRESGEQPTASPEMELRTLLTVAASYLRFSARKGREDVATMLDDYAKRLPSSTMPCTSCGSADTFYRAQWGEICRTCNLVIREGAV